MLEAIYKNRPPGSVGSLVRPFSNAIFNSYIQTKALWMSTSDLCPLEVPLNPLMHRQLLRDYTNLSDGHRGAATPASIASAIEVHQISSGLPHSDYERRRCQSHFVGLQRLATLSFLRG